MSDRPDYITGRPPLFDSEQVREWRRNYAARKALPTVAQMARDAGIRPSHMRQILSGQIYGWVR